MNDSDTFRMHSFSPIFRGQSSNATAALRILQVALLAIAAASIVLGYRFSLLLITLHTT